MFKIEVGVKCHGSAGVNTCTYSFKGKNAPCLKSLLLKFNIHKAHVWVMKSLKIQGTKTR